MNLWKIFLQKTDFFFSFIVNKVPHYERLRGVLFKTRGTEEGGPG